MAVYTKKSDNVAAIQFSPASNVSMESWFGYTFYYQILRWYDTVTQEVFTTEQTGENIINVLQILIGGEYQLVFPSDYVYRTLDSTQLNIMSETAFTAMYQDHISLHSM